MKRRKEREVAKENVITPRVKCKMEDFLFHFRSFRSSLPARAWNSARCKPRVYLVYRSPHLFRASRFLPLWSTHSTFENLNHGLPRARIPEALGTLEDVGEPKNWFLTLLHASQMRGEPELGRHYERSIVANDNE